MMSLSARRIRQAVVPAIVLAAAACPLYGQATYTSQNRMAHSWGYNGPFAPFYNITETAPDFGPFEVELTDGGYAQQSSTLNPNQLSFAGEAAGGHIQNGYTSSGETKALVTFTVDHPTRFRLHGTLEKSKFDNNGPPDAYTWVFLSGPGVNLSFQNGYEAALPFDASGLLQPGETYTFDAQIMAKGFWSNINATKWRWMDATIDFQCYADCDEDGQSSVDDFICFQTLFALGDPWADCDGDGQFAVDDFICFQTLFALGC